MQLTGIHHLTAVTADVPRNRAFYVDVLGMRLVKKTVNQDDVSAYHLFYADGLATPGTDLTFFDWNVGREQRGNHSLSRTSFRVDGETSIAFWADRFKERGIAHRATVERDRRLTLDFEDPEGQRLSLVDDGGVGEAHPWERSTVPAERQIRGLGPIEMTVPDLDRTEPVLTKLLEMRAERSYPHSDGDGEAHVFAMGHGGPTAELHVAVRPKLAVAQPGAGGVHHVAFRTPDEASYEDWVDRLAKVGVRSSGPVDRYYFRSLYFREPNGILFEIATDGPGFATDEPLDSLGESLALPPFLEPRRA